MMQILLVSLHDFTPEEIVQFAVVVCPHALLTVSALQQTLNSTLNLC